MFRANAYDAARAYDDYATAYEQRYAASAYDQHYSTA